MRERFADEAPRVVVLVDRRPSMSIGESTLRRLDKPRAILNALDLIGASAVAARSLTGYLDYADGDAYWRPPRTESRADPGTFARAFAAPADTVSRGLEFLGEHRRDLPTQAFVFVLSDFVVPPDLDVWQGALEHRWELVPVVVPTERRKQRTRRESRSAIIAAPADRRITRSAPPRRAARDRCRAGRGATARPDNLPPRRQAR